MAILAPSMLSADFKILGEELKTTEENGAKYYYVKGVLTYAGLIDIEGDYYYINPLRNKLTEGDVVRVKHTPYSLFTVDIATISEAEESEEADSTKETV